MVVSNLDDLVRTLEQFNGKLKKYILNLRRYFNKSSNAPSEYQLTQQTEQLTREAVGLKPIVQAIVGERYLTQLGQQWNPWIEAFTTIYGNSTIVTGSLNAVIQQVNEAIGYLQSKDLVNSVNSLLPTKHILRPKVFIAHDGDSDLRASLELECWRTMLEPIVVEEQVSHNESVDIKVDRHLQECVFAIVLARFERGIKQDKKTIPRGNIVDEIGRIRAKLGDRYLILLEEGLELPTNLATGVVYEHFRKEHFDAAILRVLKSLRSYHLV